MDKNKVTYIQKVITSGSRFENEVLAEDKTFIVAQNKVDTVRMFVEDMTLEDKEKALDIIKEYKIKELQIANNENLKTGLEYPASSGNLFDLRNVKIQEYLGLITFKASFTYPYYYAGVGSSSVTFTQESDVDAFINAALTAQGTIQQGIYAPRAQAVKSVTMSNGDLLTAIDAVMAVTY
jgi:hypothetical protein